jgi:hypothetical protein
MHKNLVVLILIVSSCSINRKLVDKVTLKNGDVKTGKIINCDSNKINLSRPDKTLTILNWADIDTIVGIKNKTVFFEINTGFSKSPYYSVFQYKPINSNAISIQAKVGIAKKSNKIRYVHLQYFFSKPYTINKFGYGFQRYFLGNYLKPKSLIAGSEFNLLFAKYNNTPQISIEPFLGYEMKFGSNHAVNFRTNLQWNILNKNPSIGYGIKIGYIYFFRVINKHYKNLNTTHQLN